MIKKFDQSIVTKMRAAWPALPVQAEWAAVMTHEIKGQVYEVAVLWTECPGDDAAVCDLHSHPLGVPGFAVDDLGAKENFWTSWLTAARHYEVVRITRQDRVVDYRAHGAAFDAKIAAVRARAAKQG